MFPHHENEIAQSESATHRTFVRHWFHVRFLLVEGRKMSKSEGNFYTLRDLLLRGYKASAIRMLLISVPYRQQLNFTFEGLSAETIAVERLRTFRERIVNMKWPEPSQGQIGFDAAIDDAAEAAIKKFRAALADDLNTAEARAAIFDMVRFVNAQADAGKFRATSTLSSKRCGNSTRYLRCSRITTRIGRGSRWTGRSARGGWARLLRRYWRHGA
jgi:cysteinyl-tRNA synthetase